MGQILQDQTKGVWQPICNRIWDHTGLSTTSCEFRWIHPRIQEGTRDNDHIQSQCYGYCTCALHKYDPERIPFHSFHKLPFHWSQGKQRKRWWCVLVIVLLKLWTFFLSMLKSSYCPCTVLTLHFCFILPLKRLNSQLNELLERVGYIPKFPQNDFTVNTFHLNSQLQRRVRILTLTMTVR